VVSAGLTVPTVGGAFVDYANLDHAASTPALVVVRQAVDAALQTYSSVHRGKGYASQVTSRWYEQAREEVGRFVGARAEDEVVFTRNTTDSLNLLARSLPRDTTVYVFESEHHAALLPWNARRTVRLPVPGSARDAVLLLRSALASSRGRNRLVVLSGASNVTGELWPVAELAAVARDGGARVVLDAAQLAPHRRVDLDALGVDYVALSGHKLYAPFGAGVLAGRADWLDEARPYLAGGGATRTVARAGEQVEVEWHRGTARHEAGSPNVVGAYAIASACKALTEAGFASLVTRERELLARLRDGLAAIPGVRVLSLFGEASERVGVLSFVVAGHDSSQLATDLSALYGIGVRSGLFCAHPLVRTLLGSEPDAFGECGAPDAVPGERSLDAIRVSFGAGTPGEHVERFLAALASLVTAGS
jgi:selenocysteine lyase/cysteine desulfurase